MATVKAIKYGMKGDDVSSLQTSLKNAGYNIDVDGSFGPQTLAAVKQYQQANGLTVDGMAGPQTQAALFKNNTSGSLPSQSAPASAMAPSESTVPQVSPTAPTSAALPKEPDPVSLSEQTASTSKKATTDYGDFSYDSFDYGDYQESETVKQAQAALNAALAAQPGAYESKWQTQIDDIIGRILNREEFSYDVNEDALYQQYKDQYIQGGKMAMQDTMGQAAAMTGGYGNSYAATVGNQAYQAYLSQLNEVVPELYGMALDRYNMEGEEMYNRYGLLSDQESQDYARYIDSYNQWLAERDYAASRYDSEREYDYGKYVDDRDYAYGVYSDEKNYAYDEYLNEIEQERWQAEYDETVRQYNEGMDYQKEMDANDIAYRDKVYADSRVQQELDNQYRETVRRDGIDSENRAYARDDVMNIIAVGGTPTDAQLEAAGMSKDAAEAMSAIAAGDEEAALEHVASVSYPEAIEILEDYAEDGNMFAAQGFIDDLYLTGRIDETELERLYAKYVDEDDIINTSVNPLSSPVAGGSGGKFAANYIKD